MSKVYGIFDCHVILREPTNEELGDNPNIIGVVEGPHFCPNQHSRNKGRFYPVELWEKVIADPDVQERLRNRTMFGTIGHKLDIGDEEIRQEIPSHFTAEMKIIEGDDGELIGWGRSYILNTKSGRALKVYLGAGCALYVSSRADGTYRGKVNGKPRMDPDTYVFERFDFVRRPGFLKAHPKLLESMDEDFIESIETACDAYLEDSEFDEDINLLKGVPTVEKDTTTLEKTLEELTSANELLTKSNEDLKNVNEDLLSLLKQYEDVGTVQDVQAAKVQKQVDDEFFKNNGQPQDIEDKLKKADDFFTEVGDPDDVKEAFQKIESFFTKYGQPEEIAQTLLKTSRYLEKVEELMKSKNESIEGIDKIVEELGDLESIKSALQKSEAFFTRFGDLKTVSSKLEKYEAFVKAHGDLGVAGKIIEEKTKTDLENKALKMSEKYDVDHDKVLSMLQRNMTEAEIVEYFRVLNKDSYSPYLIKKHEDKIDESIPAYRRPQIGRIVRAAGGR